MRSDIDGLFIVCARQDFSVAEQFHNIHPAFCLLFRESQWETDLVKQTAEFVGKFVQVRVCEKRNCWEAMSLLRDCGNW